jgi:hypothetical protein
MMTWRDSTGTAAQNSLGSVFQAHDFKHPVRQVQNLAPALLEKHMDFVNLRPRQTNNAPPSPSSRQTFIRLDRNSVKSARLPLSRHTHSLIRSASSAEARITEPGPVPVAGSDCPPMARQALPASLPIRPCAGLRFALR